MMPKDDGFMPDDGFVEDGFTPDKTTQTAPAPSMMDKFIKPALKYAGNAILEQGPKAMGAVIGGTLGAPLGPAGIVGGAGLGAAAVGGIEDIAHNRQKSIGQAVSDRATDVVMGGMQEAGPALKGAALQIVDKMTPKAESLLIRGIKPINRKTDFKQTLQRAVPEIDKTAQAAGKPIEKLEDLEPLIGDAKKAIWSEYKTVLGPNAKAEIDGNKIADAMEGVITKRFEMQNPQKADAIRKVAATYRRPIQLDEAEEFLQGANNDLSAFYAKNKVGQSTAARDPEWGHVVKEAETLRKELYSKLDELDVSGGTGSAELKRRYGALSSLFEEVLRRKNVAQRQNPQSLAEQISIAQGVGRGLKSAANLDIGDAAMAIGQPLAAKWMKDRNTTDALIKRGFEAYRKGVSKEPANDTLLRLLPLLTRQAGGE